MHIDINDAETKLENLDILALSDEHCTKLQREMHFIREECVALRAKVEDGLKNISTLKW
jgi:hypothetical protein